MPKIKIKNLSAEINRRIRLIKTPTSVLEVGEQNGAVVESDEYVGICLSTITIPPIISCDGAGQITGLVIGYFEPDGANQDDWIVAEQVRLKFNDDEYFINLDGTTPPYTQEPEFSSIFNQYLIGANGDFDQAPYGGEIGFWQNPDPHNPVRFEYELLPSNQTQFRVATFGDNPAHENVTPIFTRACFAPYESPITCDGAEPSFELAFAVKDGQTPAMDVVFLVDNEIVDLMNNPPPYLTREILDKLFDGFVPSGFSAGNGVAKFTNTDNIPHRIEVFTNDFENIRILVNHNPTVIQLDNEFVGADVGVCLSPSTTPFNVNWFAELEYTHRSGAGSDILFDITVDGLTYNNLVISEAVNGWDDIPLVIEKWDNSLFIKSISTKTLTNFSINSTTGTFVAIPTPVGEEAGSDITISNDGYTATFDLIEWVGGPAESDMIVFDKSFFTNSVDLMLGRNFMLTSDTNGTFLTLVGNGRSNSPSVDDMVYFWNNELYGDTDQTLVDYLNISVYKNLSDNLVVKNHNNYELKLFLEGNDANFTNLIASESPINSSPRVRFDKFAFALAPNVGIE